MGVVILLYDQTPVPPHRRLVPINSALNWWLRKRSRIVGLGSSQTDPAVQAHQRNFLSGLLDMFSGNVRRLCEANSQSPRVEQGGEQGLSTGPANLALLALVAWAVWSVISYVEPLSAGRDVEEAVDWRVHHLFSRAILIAVASLVWVPIGVYIGLRPALAERVQPVAQFLAAFPANVLFPFVVVGIVTYHLNPDIWLSPLIVLGTQWYILFNVIAGASVFPSDLREASTLYRLRRWQWWRKVILPGIFPYYVTGALTASGGSWNASIIAEVVSWGHTKLEAHGLGAYIANATASRRLPSGCARRWRDVVFVVIVNRALWRRLYVVADRRLRLE